MTVWAVIVAAGEGTRLAAGTPKALAPLADRPMIEHSLEAIQKSGAFDGVVVACGASWLDEGRRLVQSRFARHGRVVVGGQSRQQSVRSALDQIGGSATQVVVHDAARPLAGPDLFVRALHALERSSGAVCAVPVADTIKRATGDVIRETLDRSGLWRIQTPQAFRLEPLLRGHAEAARASFVGTDDASLLERIHETVVVVPGDERNIKVTTPADLALAQALLETR